MPATESHSDVDFDLQTFLPYLLNQAAEAASRNFLPIYRDRYGMTRTQWRIMAHLGKSGALTAREICDLSHVDKTKVSRGIAALENAGLLSRRPSEADRRSEFLSLTDRGRAAFADLGRLALAFDHVLRARLGAKDSQVLAGLLKRLADGLADVDPAALGGR
jgi:DNA-binding MarR family transcriptional regulator